MGGIRGEQDVLLPLFQQGCSSNNFYTLHVCLGGLTPRCNVHTVGSTVVVGGVVAVSVEDGEDSRSADRRGDGGKESYPCLSAEYRLGFRPVGDVSAYDACGVDDAYESQHHNCYAQRDCEELADEKRACKTRSSDSPAYPIC